MKIYKSYSNIDVNINENRAPTDESVRLLKEFQDKAEKQMISSLKIQNLDFECALQLTRIPEFYNVLKIRCVYKICGQSRVLEVEFNDSIENGLKELHENLSKDIAAVILSNAFEKVAKSWSGIKLF